jgi:hypothetical protein
LEEEAKKVPIGNTFNQKKTALKEMQRENKRKSTKERKMKKKKKKQKWIYVYDFIILLQIEQTSLSNLHLLLLRSLECLSLLSILNDFLPQLVQKY